MDVSEKLEEKEEIWDEAAEEAAEEETLETFNEDEYFKRQKEFFKRAFERDQLRKQQRELTQKARKEVLKELGKEDTEDEEETSSPLLRRYPETSEVSDEDYKQLVDDINRLSARNVRIIAIFTDKEAIKDVVKNRLSGTMVEEYLNNEATLHTLLDRIQSINISILHGENFENSKFGPVSKRMSDH